MLITGAHGTFVWIVRENMAAPAVGAVPKFSIALALGSQPDKNARAQTTPGFAK
jgi:hypothetical protein